MSWLRSLSFWGTYPSSHRQMRIVIIKVTVDNTNVHHRGRHRALSSRQNTAIVIPNQFFSQLLHLLRCLQRRQKYME